jgi:hypothetical protein
MSERKTGVWSVTVTRLGPLNWRWVLSQWVRYNLPGDPPVNETVKVVTATGDTLSRNGARRAALRYARRTERRRHSVETWEVEKRDG